ncbi:WD40/YVTN/BNR-like repeat-containing protein [Burkholderia sp. WSM2230]|uniref:WD40/YVTN/BNR-like repeat-containing protein n=1 Tax=Burkholderia sp. WSM2230 TaxID=944435 RepID=UPI00042A7089|nr:YCF48-related protein [Burkholderia sp. WSM2230]
MFQQKYPGLAWRRAFVAALLGTLLATLTATATAAAAAAAAAAALAGAQTSVGAALPNTAPSDPFIDPLDAAAVMHPDLAKRPLMSVVRVGQRLIAVGMRGLIVGSSDGGKTWSQVQAPVRSDLLALSFPDTGHGWIAGHDGVILHSADGGRTWNKQFDGRVAQKTLIDNYRTRIAAGDAALKPYLDQLLLNYKAGPSLPLLGVWFKDALHGIAVGPFGMAIVTDDGGKHWAPMLERIENPAFLHLQAISEVAGDVFIAAEKGTIFKLDQSTGVFRPVETGYAGSLFGVTGNDNVLIAYGLKGTVYRSADRGASWTRVDSPLHGLVTAAAYVAQRRAFVLVTAAGEIALADETAREIHVLKAGRPVAATGVQPRSAHEIVLSGLDGVHAVALP